MKKYILALLMTTLVSAPAVSKKQDEWVVENVKNNDHIQMIIETNDGIGTIFVAVNKHVFLKKPSLIRRELTDHYWDVVNDITNLSTNHNLRSSNRHQHRIKFEWLEDGSEMDYLLFKYGELADTFNTMDVSVLKYTISEYEDE